MDHAVFIKFEAKKALSQLWGPTSLLSLINCWSTYPLFHTPPNSTCNLLRLRLSLFPLLSHFFMLYSLIRKRNPAQNCHEVCLLSQQWLQGHYYVPSLPFLGLHLYNLSLSKMPSYVLSSAPFLS